MKRVIPPGYTASLWHRESPTGRVTRWSRSRAGVRAELPAGPGAGRAHWAELPLVLEQREYTGQSYPGPRAGRSTLGRVILVLERARVHWAELPLVLEQASRRATREVRRR